MKIQNKYLLIIQWLVFALGCFVIFFELDKLSLIFADEARYGNNSIEMAFTNNPFVVTFDGKPDMGNTKPPLLFWLQALSMKIFGFNEFGLRFPSALAGCGTILILLRFFSKTMQKPLIGVLSVLVLVSSQGYLTHHVVKTGDTEALLVFFITLYIISFYKYFKFGSKKALLTACLGIFLAVITKGVAGLIPLLGLFLGILAIRGFRKKINFKLVVYLGSTIILCFCIYLIREIYNPGYLKAVWNNEMGGRYFRTQGYQKHNFRFYLSYMRKTRFFPFMYFIPFSILSIYFLRKNLQQLGILICISCTVFGLIISLAKTKLLWYDAPIYPQTAILISLLLYQLLTWLNDRINWEMNTKRIVSTFIIVGLFSYPVYNVFEKNRLQGISSYEMEGFAMKSLKKTRPEVKKYTVLKPGHINYLDVAKFYQKAWEFSDDYQISIANFIDFEKGRKILVCQKEYIKRLDELYIIKKIEEQQEYYLVEILKEKY